MFALHLFGVVHVDRYGKVRSELESYLDSADADAVFLESQGLEPRRFVRGVARAPLSLFGFVFYSLVGATLLLPLTRQYATPEFRSALELADEREVSLYLVDRDVYEFSTERGLSRTLAEWVVLQSVGSLAPLGNAVLFSAGPGGVTLVAALARRSRRLASPSERSSVWGPSPSSTGRRSGRSCSSPSRSSRTPS